MVDVFIQTLWCWTIPIGLLMLISILPLVSRRTFSGWRQKGCWSMGVYLMTLAICAMAYLAVNAAGIYVYRTPNEALEVVVPTPTPRPPEQAPDDDSPFSDLEPMRGEEIIASMIRFPVLAFVEYLRPFIPLFLGGLTLLLLFAFGVGFVRARVTREQNK